MQSEHREVEVTDGNFCLVARQVNFPTIPSLHHTLRSPSSTRGKTPLLSKLIRVVNLTLFLIYSALSKASKVRGLKLMVSNVTRI